MELPVAVLWALEHGSSVIAQSRRKRRSSSSWSSQWSFDAWGSRTP
jgi:hypothetical protein